MPLYDNEENAVVNQEPTTSETPSDLVSESPDAAYEDKSQHDSKLSPNPAGFGFTKQLIVTELPASGAVNTLYLVKVTDGGKFIGYRLFKWTKLDGFVQFGATPDLLLKDGPRERPVKVNNAPKAAPEKVFTGDVVFYEEPIIKGKPLHEYIDSQGGVTEAELQAAINALSQTLTGQINQKQDKITTTSAPAGSVEKLLGFNSEGEIVSGDVPAGSTIDDDLDSTSPNPVKNSGIVEGLEKDIADGYDSTATYAVGDLCLYNGVLYKCVTAITAAEAWNAAHWTQVNIDNEFVHESELEDYAKVDGNYPTLTAGAADNFTPYGEESGTDQEQPFLLQGTGCGNGEQQVDTGALALLKEKQGNTVVVNQLVNPANYVNVTTQGYTNNNVTYTKQADGSILINGTATGNYSSTGILFQEILKGGHKYLLIGAPAGGENKWGFGFGSGFGTRDTGNGFIYSPQSDVGNGITFYCIEGTTFNNAVLRPTIIDLTQWFGSNDNIPPHLLAHPEDFFRYYQGSLAYNAGELVNSNGRYLKTIGRNQWDEEWELGNIGSDGQNASSSGEIRSKNYIRCIPNETYYSNITDKAQTLMVVYFYDANKNLVPYTGTGAYANGYNGSSHTFNVPSNACYMRFRMTSVYGTTYNNDITISLYYEGESGYDQYYPYEELANIDTGTEVLRSAGSVKDSKAPDGTITRRVGVVDLSTLNWTYDNGGYYYAVFTSIKTATKNVKSTKYLTSNLSVSNPSCPSETIEVGTQMIFVKTSVEPTGTLYFELAEPTTEEGTSFSENVQIDDFGSMDFGGANGVPQGASIFYAVDYKAFIDSLYNTLDGDATDVVKESELDSKLATLGYVKLTSVTGYDATKTQVLKNIEGTLTWVTEE